MTEKIVYENTFDGKSEVKIGDILYTSWGYDQTNSEFYKVMKIVGKKYFTIQRLSQETTEKGFMQGTTIPIKGEHVGEPFKAYVSRGRWLEFSLSAGDVRSLGHWSGKPVSVSWYA